MVRSQEALTRRAQIRALKNGDASISSDNVAQQQKDVVTIEHKHNGSEANAKKRQIGDSRCTVTVVQDKLSHSVDDSAIHGKVARGNNWNCHFCKNVNYSFRPTCNRCCRHRMLADSIIFLPSEDKTMTPSIATTTSSSEVSSSLVVSVSMDHEAIRIPQVSKELIGNIVQKIAIAEKKPLESLIRKNQTGWTAKANKSTIEHNQKLRQMLLDELETGIPAEMSSEDRIRAALLLERSQRKAEGKLKRKRVVSSIQTQSRK
jgi:hypothetical protein